MIEPPVTPISVENDLGTLVSLAKHHLMSVDTASLAYSLPSGEAKLLFGALVALSEGKQLETRPWIKKYLNEPFSG